MVKIKRREKVAVFKSVLGRNIKLDILIKDGILKVTIFNSLYSIICRRGTVLVILTVCSFLGLILNVLNVKVAFVLFIAILLDFFYKLSISVKEENLVIIKGLGYQVTSKYMLGVKTVFIPEEQVQNIFINEVIFRRKVIYVLSLLTIDKQTRERLIPLFFDTLPRLACLKLVYKNVKEFLG